MDEKKRKEQRDPVYFVTRAQVVVCLILGLALFGATRWFPAAGAALRRDFGRLTAMQLDVGAVRTAAESFKTQWTAENAQPTDGVSADAPSVSADGDALQPSEPTDADRVPPTEAPPTTDPEPQTDAPTAETPTVQPRDVRAATEPPAAEPMTQPAATAAAIVQPVDNGRYTSYFGDRMNPITHQRAFHTGLDIAVPEGTKIKAAWAGTVRKVGEDDRSGKYIILSHGDGTETFYCHCSAILADEGDTVAAGAVIARVGETGWATGPHLHFEVRENGERVDPLPILTGDDG
ncbi:MAG: peptidoglycan DD-metalloendopeptidase family protein [Clostridia bacterium]|nr:peptidoglycan DD-metalloendopeptidase family protein [Clostridia bacterium]